jgi:hypothetical protein
LYKKNAVVCSVAKASSLLTRSGRSLVNALKKLSNLDEWYYYPIVKIEDSEHKAEMFFTKLNAKAEHIFRFEVFKDSEYDVDELLSLLRDNSKDPVFLGYPYGLIEADKFARVSNDEKGYYQMMIRSFLGNELDESESILNSHDILDSIS